MRRNRLFKLLLRSELVGMTALSLSAVGGTGRETSVALSADGLFAVELGSKSFKRGLNNTTTETENQVESRLLLDIVIAESATVFKLLTSENQTLLVWGNSLLILNLGLDIVNSVGRLDLKGDGYFTKKKNIVRIIFNLN